jgi:hypothetical protein
MSDTKELAIQPGIEDGFGLELKIIEATIGKIITNAAEVLNAARQKCEEYADVEKFVGHEDLAKKERALLNKAVKQVDVEAKRIKDAWMSPLDQFDATMKEVKEVLKTASGDLDSVVKNAEGIEKEKKRQEIQAYFGGKDFDLVPLDMFFDDRWLNKGYKMPDIKKEIDGQIEGVYSNIKILESIADHGMAAKAFYLETLDMGTAMSRVQSLKDNAERLAREKANREEREVQEQVARNIDQERKEERAAVRESEIKNLANEALDIKEPTAPDGPEIMEFTLRFRGPKEKLFEMKKWMTTNGIAYEKIG